MTIKKYKMNKISQLLSRFSVVALFFAKEG